MLLLSKIKIYAVPDMMAARYSTQMNRACQAIFGRFAGPLAGWSGAEFTVTRGRAVATLGISK
ncbi:MAG: hypothetical protein DMG22_00400 [Acidobacteria bacterium]|nr:MAG: hypothetical protein DMG22_00400 [Acidobacteriota bacterium]